MGVIDFFKKLKLREWINIGFFLVSLAMLIAGSVMLAVAIASIPPMPPFPEDLPTTTPSVVPANASSTPMPTNPLVQTTTVTYPQGVICDASSKSLLNIFLVDVSVPLIGTLDDKLNKISTLLMNAPALINLKNSDQWTNQEFRIVAYGGVEPIPIGRARNFQTWQTIVGMVNSTTVNPTNLDGHQVTDALRFVYNNYRLPYGYSGNIVVIGDGFDYDEIDAAPIITTALKTQYFYSLGFLVISTSNVQRNIFQSLATDFSHFYPMDNFGYLENPTILDIQAQWACNAFFPTPIPPTPPPTRVPLITTVSPSNPPVVSTMNPLLPPISSCKQNVLFLIDQSQTMILDGYSVAIQYSINTAKYLANLNSNTTFAFIVYNRKIVSESQTYTNLPEFITNINQVPEILGNSDITVGLSEASKFISLKSQYSDDSVTSLLYFITDGTSLEGSASYTNSTVKNIRSYLETEVIGINLIETVSSKRNVQSVIQYGASDGYSNSIYVGFSKTADALDQTTLNSTIYKLQCKGSSGCVTGLTFVIESSEAEGETYTTLQQTSILNILTHYHNILEPFQFSVSVVYFSSPDSLTPDSSGYSGILFGQQANLVDAINDLNTTHFSLGPASDLQLGFEKTLESLQNGYMQNNNLVIFMARGSYEKLSNCCPDPTSTALAVRQISTVQGVVVGPYSSKDQLDALTGSNSIDANALIADIQLNSTTMDQASQRISNAIIPIIDKFMEKQYCPGIPSLVNPPCEDPIDVLILLHANDQNNWQLIVNFTSQQLIPDLLGKTGQFSSRLLTTSTPINFAIASYYYLDVLIHADFTYLRSLLDYQNLVNSIPFKETKGTATLSTAYKKAIEIFEDGRPYASKNLILITDTVDASDAENSFSEHDAMVQLVGGYTSALSLRTSALSENIPGNNYQITIDPPQLQLYNKYSVRQVANALTTKTCIYAPLQAPTNPPTPPSPTLPGPIPLVKARSVWPDITILIDTSNDSANPMTDILFEKVRTFLDTLLNQYSVGEKGSRFTLATYDGETVDYSCIFSDINNYYDLSSCRNEKLSLLQRTHQNYRSLQKVLENVRENVFENSTSGYRSLNENFMIIFTLGSSTSDFQQEQTKLERKGIRTIAIGLTTNMTNQDLSAFARTTFKIADWSSMTSGIDTNLKLADTIYQITTKKRSPSSANFFGNLVFVVDQSKNSWTDYNNVVSYVTSFVKPYLVSDVKTQISIVPFADSTINPLPLSSTSQQVDQWLNDWKSNGPSGSNVTDVGTAIQYVLQTVGQNPDRPTYLIFVLGASNITGSEIANQLLKAYNPYVADYNSSYNYAYKNLVHSSDNIFTVASSQELLNREFPMNILNSNPILTLENDISDTQEGNDQVTFPTSSIAADIVFLLDETGLSDSDFANVKRFLSDLVHKFSIGVQSTQFALQTYNGRTIPHDGFHLYESTNIGQLDKIIQQLTLAKATENSDADLAGAIEQELFFFLTEKNGWRDDTTTYTIILSHADSFFTRDTDTAIAIKNSSTVFALGMNGRRFEYVANFTNSNFYETVNDVSSLSINSPAVTDLITSINNDYKHFIYPEPINVKSIVKANFIVFVDSSVGTESTFQVKQFLTNFLSNVATFSSSGNDTKLAVVTYGKATNVLWNLQDAQDVDSLRRSISQINIPYSSGVSNLRRAIDSVILNEAGFGVTQTRPNYMIFITQSASINPNIDTATSKHLNTRYSTFVIQKTYGNSTFTYVPQVLGTQWSTDRVVFNSELDYGQMKDKFEPWVANEYTAWTSTFSDQISLS